tara:strand:- start:1331 stop:1675 length:345 start_codon:yes stop_codon:yes gene_type:complete
MNKKQIKNLVKEANKELFCERYPYFGDEQAQEIKQDTFKFDKYSEQTYMLLQQLQRDVVADFETNNLSDIQIEYLVGTILPRIAQQVQYSIDTISAMKNQGIKHTDSRDFNPYE